MIDELRELAARKEKADRLPAEKRAEFIDMYDSICVKMKTYMLYLLDVTIEMLTKAFIEMDVETFIQLAKMIYSTKRTLKSPEQLSFTEVNEKWPED